MLIDNSILLLVAKCVCIVGAIFYVARIVAKYLSSRIVKKSRFAKHLLRFTSMNMFWTSGASYNSMIGKDYFGRVLSIYRHITGEVDLKPEANILRFHIRVPSNLCTVGRHGHLALDLGAILALADEITTVLIVCSDASFRPGTSHFATRLM